MVGTLDNYGTINDSGTGGFALGTLGPAGGFGGTVLNEAGALYDFKADVGMSNGFGGQFINQGTLRKSAGTGFSNFGNGLLFVFSSQGNVDVQTGTITIPTYGQSSTGQTFTVAANAVLDLSGLSSGTLNGVYTGSGPGFVEFNAGEILLGKVTFNFSGGGFRWDGGSLTGGSLLNQGLMTIVSDVNLLTNFQNNGTFVQTAGTLTLIRGGPFGFTTGSISNNSSGVINIQDGSGISSGSSVTNAGILRKSGGNDTYTISSPVDNSGTLEVDAGSLALGGSLNEVSGSTLTGGTFIARNGATLNLPSGTNITTNQGSLTLDGAGSTISGLNNLANNSGSLTLANGNSFSIAGNLDNTGVISLGAGSLLTVNGAYTQGSSGSLNVQIADHPATGQFGKLSASGAASLGGTFSVALANGFGPSAGEQYQLMSYSSATGSFATIQQPIFHGGNLFQVQTNATNVTVAATTGVADLNVTSVSATSTSVQPGQNLTVNYSVTNQGSATPATSWVDSIFLSASGKLDSSAILLGRVNQTGPVAGGGGYSGSLTVSLPAVPAGNYFVIVEADSRGLVPDSNRADGVLASTAPVQVSVPTLMLSPAGGTPTPVTGTLAAGQDEVFQVNVPAADDVQINLSTGATAGAAELLVGYQTIPTTASNFALAFDPSQTQQQVELQATQAGTYFVVLHGTAQAGAGTSFSLDAQELPFTIQSFTPGQGTNAGPVTMTITGNQFSSQTVVSLSGPKGAHLSPTNLIVQDSHTLFATFDLSGAAAGSYTLQASQNGQQVVAANAFQISSGQAGSLYLNASAPSAIRPGVTYELTIDYANTGGTDIPAPLIAVSSPDARFRLAEQSAFTSGGIMLLAINPNGPAGVLPPGFHGELTVFYQSTDAAAAVDLSVQDLDLSSPIDWNQFEQNFSAQGVLAPAAQQAILSNFIAMAGNTQGSLQTFMDQLATRLAQIGQPTYDFSRLLSFGLATAGDFGAIAARYQLGALGFGMPDPTDYRQFTDPAGNINVRTPTVTFLFSPQSDGRFQSALGDGATISVSSQGDSVQASGGTTYSFNSNGTLKSITDRNGNVTTAVYTGNLLTSLVNSVQGTTSFTYNSQGRITQITDPDGRITTLTYDPTSQYLLSITAPRGTTSFTYVTGSTPQQNNALASITHPDGTHIFFQYDGLGRLVSQSLDGGAEATTVSYDAAGGETITDASGAPTQVLLGPTGQAAQITDPLGRLTHFYYDSYGRLVKTVGSDGETSTTTYDASGNATQITNPLGQTVQQTFQPGTNYLQSFTDPRGNAIQKTLDPATGNVLAVTYPDGSQEQFSYDPLGDATQFVNRNGQAIQYTYSSQGLLTSETFPDGSSYKYAYDAHRNLISATDSTGTTTFDYDSADRLTKVSYPNGQFLQFTYNAAGQRTQMVDQSGFTVNYQYDSLDRLQKLADGHGNLIVAYTYDSAGRVIRKDFGNGTFTTIKYDAAGEIVNITNDAPDGSSQSTYQYTYDDFGRPLTVTTQAGTTTYGYDAAGQLISVKSPSGDTTTYQYDAAGNRLSVTDNGVTTPYVANNLNEYTSVGSSTLQYDAAGNLIRQTDSTGTTAYSYNAAGQLVSVTSPTGTTTYQYDALGNLISEDVNGQVTNYLVDPTGQGSVVASSNASGSLISHYVYGQNASNRVAIAQNILAPSARSAPVGNPALLVAQAGSSGVPAYFSFDNNGNTTQLTGQNGTVLANFAYSPFGQLSSQGASFSTPFTFSGQFGVMADPNSLYYMRNRWMDPILGRFTQPDPLGVAGLDANFYRYVGNGPFNLSDPTGLCPTGNSTGFAVGLGLIITGLGTVALVTAGILAPEITIPAIASIGFEGATVTTTSVGLGTAGGGFVTGIVSAVPRHDPCPDCLQPHSHDPNEITGPATFDSNGFVAANQTLPYRIDFTNEASASAPADSVVVTQQLDPSLDLSTFQLGDIGFGNTIIHVPTGLSSYSTTVMVPSTAPDAGPNGLDVEINASLNLKTGLVTWTFTGLDPTTHDIPVNPLVGFLPPDVTGPEGEGFVSYTIKPKISDTTGTVINAQAAVVFDQNPALITKQISAAIDAGVPTSSVAPLPATTTSPTFTVSWSGHDDPGGSGLDSFDVFVSDNGGAFTSFLLGTTQTSATFTGQVGHTYRFYSVATDNAGNGQPTPTAAQATIAVVLPPPPSPLPAPPAPPTLQVPPLLAFIDSLLGGVETVNSNGTETVTDILFGIPLLVSTFDSSGKLVSVDLFGFDVTFLFI